MLDLGHNHLAAVPASFGALRDLEFLYLSNNRLSHLPDSYKTLTQSALPQSSQITIFMSCPRGLGISAI